MGKIKGCGNETCEAHKKKLIYKESESFCSKCGSPLVYVCKDCYTKLSDDTAKYCVRCLQIMKIEKTREESCWSCYWNWCRSISSCFKIRKKAT